MDVLILNGCLPDGAVSDSLQDHIIKTLALYGHQYTSIYIKDLNIKYCRGCFGCWTKTPGVCVITNDDANAVTQKVINSDLWVILTPLSFGCYSSGTKKAIDRVIPLVSPFFVKIGSEIHHKKRYGKYPKVLAIGMVDEFVQKEVDTFCNLAYRNSINLHTEYFPVVISADRPCEKEYARIDQILNGGCDE